METIKNDHVFFVDCDDTLVLWDTKDFPEDQWTWIDHAGYKTMLVPHTKNIEVLKKFARLGNHITVWSATGYEWADAIVKHLGLTEYVHQVMSKPRYYMDDLPCQVWMGERVYYDPLAKE